MTQENEQLLETKMIRFNEIDDDTIIYMVQQKSSPEDLLHFSWQSPGISWQNFTDIFNHPVHTQQSLWHITGLQHFKVIGITVLQPRDFSVLKTYARSLDLSNT